MKKNNNYIKKVTLLTIALIVFVLGMTSPKAEVIVKTAEDLRAQLNNTNIKTVKLGADITTNNYGGVDLNAASVPGKIKILDLNGFNLKETGNSGRDFRVGYYVGEFHIINTSVNKSTLSASYGLNFYPSKLPKDEYRDLKLIIDNVDIHYSLPNSGDKVIGVLPTSAKKKLNITFKM